MSPDFRPRRLSPLRGTSLIRGALPVAFLARRLYGLFGILGVGEVQGFGRVERIKVSRSFDDGSAETTHLKKDLDIG